MDAEKELRIMYLDDVKRLFAEVNARTHIADAVHPCTEQEIAQLERQYHLTLPPAYQEFLRWMGHGAGRFLAGDGCFYDALPQLRAYALELLEENHVTYRLPDDAFVFSMHDGYQFLFFRVSEGENPPVYWYGEGEPVEGSDAANPFSRRFERYSDFLVAAITEEEQVYDQIAALNAERLQQEQAGGR